MKPYYKDPDADITIYHGDCLEIMKDFPDKSFDLVLTSPPYNFDAGSGLGCKYDYEFQQKGYKDNYRPEEYFEKQSNAIESMIRISSHGVFYNIQMISGNKDSLLQIIGKFCFQIKEIIIWNKKTAEPAINENCLNSQFEFILVFHKNNKRKFEYCNFEKGTLSNVWDISKNSENRHIEHSAMMPSQLAKRIIDKFSKHNNIILDPFMGSGTTLIAAKELKRRAVGIEISEKYCAIAAQRLKNTIVPFC